MTKSKKIAIVEDEQALQSALVEWFSMEGYEVLGITTGKEALEKIPQFLPALILLDMILPIKNGLEVIAGLKKLETTAKIPIIVLTNLEDLEERKKAFNLGAKEYLVKTEYEFSALSKIVKIYL